MRSTATDVARSVVCVSVLGTLVRPAETDAPIEMLFLGQSGRLVSTQCYHHGRRRQHRSSRYIQTIRPVYTDVTEQNRTELNFLDTFEICKLLSVSPVQFISVLSRQGVNGPLYNCSSSSSSDRHDVAESHAAVLFFGCCFVGRQSSATGSTADVI